MPGIGIISNPFARINKQNPDHNKLMWYYLGNKGQFEVTNSLEELASVCAGFQARGVDLVGIIGGDGTISLTLSALLKAYGVNNLPRIMLLRGGTVNVVAANLGIFGKPKDVVADFLDTFHSGKTLHEMCLHTLLVNGQLGFLFGNGIAARFLSEFYENKSTSLGAALFLARVMADGLVSGRLNGRFPSITRAEPMGLQVEITEEDSPNGPPLQGAEYRDESLTPHTMILASTVPNMPFGINLYKRLRTEKPEAQLIRMTTEGSPLLGQAVKVLLGGKLERRGEVEDFLMKRATLRVSPGSPYTLDGELLVADNGRIIVEVGPSFVFCSPYGKVL